MKPKQTKPRPTHIAFMVEGDRNDSKWTEIGAVWPHDDGKGFNVALKALPLAGKVVLRQRADDKDKETTR